MADRSHPEGTRTLDINEPVRLARVGENSRIVARVPGLDRRKVVLYREWAGKRRRPGAARACVLLLLQKSEHRGHLALGETLNLDLQLFSDSHGIRILQGAGGAVSLIRPRVNVADIENPLELLPGYRAPSPLRAAI